MENLFIENEEEKKVRIPLGSPHKYDLDDNMVINYSNNSPFIACVIAYHMGAKNIFLDGVDFTQNHFFAETGTHMLNKDLKIIINTYNNLYKEMEKNGVGFRNLSEESLLEIPKITIEEFIKQI